MAPEKNRFAKLPPCELAVIGGGISGLAAAHRLRELAPQLTVRLFESKSCTGGVLKTERPNGFLLEHSADMFTTLQPWAMDLCRRIDFESELVLPNEQHRRAFVVKANRLLPVPDGLSLLGPSRVWPLVTTRLLGLSGKLRMLGEMLVSKSEGLGDESLAAFTRRRLGGEAFDWLIQPLVGGIYTADPEKLSMQATLPQFLKMEQEHGSLFRGMRKNRQQRQTDRQASGARYGTFRAPREGMIALVNAITNRLPAESVVTDCTVRGIRPVANETSGWLVDSDDGRSWPVAGVLIATPATVSSKLTESLDKSLSEDLRRIPLAGVVIVALGLRREQIAHPLNGFGFVVPQRASRNILAGSFSSVKFEGRAPDGQILLRAFVGGACQPELMDNDDDTIVSLVWKDLQELIGVSGKPTVRQVIRWKNIMPQYHVGHTQLVEQIEARVEDLDRFELAGNAYRGVGIPFCVRSGEQAAERLLAALQPNF